MIYFLFFGEILYTLIDGKGFWDNITRKNTESWSSETGLLTIGPRFGGAIDDAARYFKDAYDRVRRNKFCLYIWNWPPIFLIVCRDLD
jgi:hypothetical protein